MKFNSKWSYINVGINIMVTVIGVLLHSAFLLFMGITFTIWNWNTAERTRRIEDEEIRKSATETEE